MRAQITGSAQAEDNDHLLLTRSKRQAAIDTIYES